MTTARNIVSKIRGMLKMHSPDIFITDRLILSQLLPINNKILSQQISQRKAWGIDQLFHHIPCLEMEEVPLYECCDIESDCKIAKSTKKLPDIVDSYYNLAIRSVSSIDGRVKFNELSTPERYKNILTLYPNSKKKYFFMKNGYLYITDPEVEKIQISALFKGLVDPDEFSCGSEEIDCPKNPLDLEFKTLPKIEEDVVRLSMQGILTSFSQIVKEKTSNDLIEGD